MFFGAASTLIGLVRILLVAEIEQVSANRSPVDREPWPSNQTGGNAAPSDWECHWRKAALQFGNRLQPWMTAEQQADLIDALELSGERGRLACGTHRVPPVTPPPAPPPSPLPPLPPPTGFSGCWDTHGLRAPVLQHQCREHGWAPTGNNPNGTVEACAQCCSSQVGTAFIGLGGCGEGKCGTQCACLSRLPTSGAVSETQCDVPCPGNHTERCGSDWRYQLYNASGLVASQLASTSFAWFVDPHKGVDSNSGTAAEPFKSIQAALEASRKHRGARTIQLRAGVYFDTALNFTAIDSGLTLASYDGPGLALLTGGTRIEGTWSPLTRTEQHQRFPACPNTSTVVKMNLSALLPLGTEVEGLQLMHSSNASLVGSLNLSRATRARFPNVDSIETNLYPDGWISGGQGVHWIGKTFTDKSTVRFKNFSRTQETPLYGMLHTCYDMILVHASVILLISCIADFAA